MIQRQKIFMTVFILLTLQYNSSSASEDAEGYWDWNKMYNVLADWTCKFKSECCRPPFIRPAGAVNYGLRKTLKSDFFGQHIAVKTVLNALDAHLSDDSPKKPLVLSFHGWAGSGKTYLAHLIANALYQKGIESNYIRLYSASYHFPDETRVSEYKTKLQNEISATIKSCDRALIIFDEVDVTPPSLFDSLVSFLDYSNIVSADQKKATYIFLSNIGSTEISIKTRQAWEDGKSREDLTFNDFHVAVSKASFNALKTGMGKTRIIEKSLVDFFIPFLPMERRHVIECAKVEIQRQGATVDPETIADQMTYWPEDTKLFSTTGCKRVEALVKYAISESKFKDEL